MAAAGITVVGGHLLDTYAPWMDYDQQINQTLRITEEDGSMTAKMQKLVHYATLAASGHNTQPWKFAIRENTIQIHPDYTRRLPVVDPDDRELWISLGCALENLLVAARAAGYDPQVTYPDAIDLISIYLEPAVPQNSPLFEALPGRLSTRSEYDGRSVRSDDLAQVQALPVEPGVVLQFINHPAGLETVLEYVHQGNLRQYADKAFVGELIAWLRFNKKEALASLDGLYSRCTGNPDAPRWLGRLFVSGTKPQQQADIDARRLRSSPGVVVVASEADNKTSWVRAGQVFERLALKLTALNLKNALLNQPVEVAELRLQFQSAMELGAHLPQLLVRFGYAGALPRSLRRPVEQVLVRPA
jgi:hypothetical protein